MLFDLGCLLAFFCHKKICFQCVFIDKSWILSIIAYIPTMLLSLVHVGSPFSSFHISRFHNLFFCWNLINTMFDRNKCGRDFLSSYVFHLNGSVQESRNSIANALELRLSCTNPSIWYVVSPSIGYFFDHRKAALVSLNTFKCPAESHTHARL